MSRDLSPHPVTIGVVNEPEPFFGIGPAVAIGIPQHLIPAAGKVNFVSGKFPVPQAIVGAARRESISFLTLGQGQRAYLDLRQHVIERVDEHPDLAARICDGPDGIVPFNRNCTRDLRKFRDRHCNRSLQSGTEQQRNYL
jgi:hypothetical protein